MKNEPQPIIDWVNVRQVIVILKDFHWKRSRTSARRTLTMRKERKPSITGATVDGVIFTERLNYCLKRWILMIWTNTWTVSCSINFLPEENKSNTWRVPATRRHRQFAFLSHLFGMSRIERATKAEIFFHIPSLEKGSTYLIFPCFHYHEDYRFAHMCMYARGTHTNIPVPKEKWDLHRPPVGVVVIIVMIMALHSLCLAIYLNSFGATYVLFDWDSVCAVYSLLSISNPLWSISSP